MSVASPVGIGEAADVAITVIAGPSCSGSVRYPSGTTRALSSHLFLTNSTWHWTWTVPDTAGHGTAKVFVICTYAGITKGDSVTPAGTFQIP